MDEIEIKVPGTEKPRRRFFVRYIIALFSLLIIFFALWFTYELYTPHTNFHGEKSIEIPAGFGSRLIGGFLRDQGFIQSKWAFVTLATFKNQASSLKPGFYVFSESSTLPQILESLVQGEKYPNERFVTIPEGWSIRDIGLYFGKNGIASSTDFWVAAGLTRDGLPTTNSKIRADILNRFPFLAGETSPNLDGYLFPDTYRFYRNATIDQILTKMLANFGSRVDASYYRTAEAQNKSFRDVLIVASLIEKEAASDQDRKTVSDIIWKRLQQGIPLQIDATLLYINGESSAHPTASDKSLNSLYNTYRFKGLPPGPITNPGLDAINAALHPVLSPYLYYLSTPDGTLVFSKTLQEHQAAINRYY